VKQLHLRLRVKRTMPPSVDASPLGKLDAFKLALTDECPLDMPSPRLCRVGSFPLGFGLVGVGERREEVGIITGV